MTELPSNNIQEEIQRLEDRNAVVNLSKVPLEGIR